MAEPVQTGRRWKTWQVVTVAFVALILGAAIGGAGSEEDGDDVASDGTTTTTTEEEAEESTTTERPTTTDAPTTTTTRPTTTTAPPQPVEVMRAESNADTQTDDFTVKGKWELHWQVSGGAGVNVVISTPSGEQVDFVSVEPGAGKSSFRQAGTYYLDISTFGASYLFTVVDVPG